MFWTGKSCQKQDLTYEVISGPENGKIIQEKKIEPLDSIKIKAAKIYGSSRILVGRFWFFS